MKRIFLCHIVEYDLLLYKWLSQGVHFEIICPLHVQIRCGSPAFRIVPHCIYLMNKSNSLFSFSEKDISFNSRKCEDKKPSKKCKKLKKKNKCKKKKVWKKCMKTCEKCEATTTTTSKKFAVTFDKYRYQIC